MHATAAWDYGFTRSNGKSYRTVHSVRAAWVLMGLGWHVEEYATDGITLSLGA